MKMIAASAQEKQNVKNITDFQKKNRRYKDMAKYYISHNDYFGYCVIEEINGTGKIVFAGSIEDCNAKCIELNSTL